MTTDTDIVPTSTAVLAVTCPRDGAATRLTCARCRVPICPSCLTRTAVGMRCPDCSGPQRRPRRRGLRVIVAVVAVVIAVLGGVVTQLGGEPTDVAQEEVAVPMPLAGLGQMVTVGSFAVTVTRFDCTNETGLRRCVTTLAVRNDALGARVFPTSLQRVVGGIRRFVPSSVAGAGDTASAMVNPGAVAEVNVVFLVPETLDATRLELRSSARQTPVRVALPA